jgi:predicted DNA-binding transcriptional regulator AlpA
MLAQHEKNGSSSKSDGRPALDPLLVGARELAPMLGISQSTFWRWDSSGELGPSGVKKGGRRLWPVAEVQEWVVAGMPPRPTWLVIRRGRMPK